MTEEQRNGIATITVRIEAGEQAVTDELLPMLAAAHELGHFDWVMFLSTFMQGGGPPLGVLQHLAPRGLQVSTPAEKAAYWPLREHTNDPTGRFRTGEPVYEGIPKYGEALMDAVRSAIGRRSRRLPFLHRLQHVGRGRAHDADLRDRHRHVHRLGRPATLARVPGILADEGRHHRSAPRRRILIAEHPAYEALVHEVVDEYCGNAVGMLEYQRGRTGARPAEVPDAEGAPLQEPLPRDAHLSGRGADRSHPRLSVDFVVGVQADDDGCVRRRGRRYPAPTERRQAPMTLRWECLEAGCSAVVTAGARTS